ncbi:Hypothetical predicted protein [Olea europaea subsp. europaea]|uniref:Uncharacterized protein n=1 Tax=Olea europaea subsp. europaea TaxID=158383 RepID=A0A8S0TQB5_OLEEU|nr:Hypothetical predicted protein [Olea europaea subsp. europaea]
MIQEWFHYLFQQPGKINDQLFRWISTSMCYLIAISRSRGLLGPISNEVEVDSQTLVVTIGKRSFINKSYFSVTSSLNIPKFVMLMQSHWMMLIKGCLRTQS